MEEADLMPQLLANISDNLALLGKTGIALKWRYYLDFEDFKGDIRTWKDSLRPAAFEIECPDRRQKTKVSMWWLMPCTGRRARS